MSYSSSPLPKHPHPEVLSKLAAAIPLLQPNDKKFALSLHDYHVKHGGWSDKQYLWAMKMVDKAGGIVIPESGGPGITNYPVQAAAAQEPQKIGALHNIFSLLSVAAHHLKKPAVVLSVQVPETGQIINIAVKRSKSGDMLWVTNPQFYGVTYGKVMPTGEWVSKAGTNQYIAEAIYEALKEFAADPAAVAAKHGKLTGKCCFCNKTLTDPQSTHVGYGPVCAQNFHLPWGSKKWSPAKGSASMGKAFVGGASVGTASDPSWASSAVSKPTHLHPLDPEIAAEAKAEAVEEWTPAELALREELRKDTKVKHVLMEPVRYLF